MSEEEIARALRERDKKEREWLDSHKDQIKNINNMVDDLEKDKKVQKVVETFSRWQDPTIEKLQIEKLQLERQVDMAHHVLSATRKERDKYKEVIEEVREYIEKETHEITYDNDEKGICLDLYDREILELLQILDKAKDVK